MTMYNTSEFAKMREKHNSIWENEGKPQHRSGSSRLVRPRRPIAIGCRILLGLLCWEDWLEHLKWVGRFL